MITASAIDEVTVWFSAAILGDPAHETDRMVIDRVAEETNPRPLAEIIDEMQDEHREDAGEFGLGQEAFLSCLGPASRRARPRISLRCQVLRGCGLRFGQGGGGGPQGQGCEVVHS